MELSEVIRIRRSIRKFKNEKLGKSVVEDILNCGRLAPSAKNKQPWYFVVLENDIKNKVANLMIENYKRGKEKEKIGFNSSVIQTAKVILEAPILIIIFREKDDNWIIGDNLSIGACVENMCLRATDLGLGSLWIRDVRYVSLEVSKMLNHEDLELNCAVCLGIPNEAPKQRSRKNLNEIMEWYNE